MFRCPSPGSAQVDMAPNPDHTGIISLLVGGVSRFVACPFFPACRNSHGPCFRLLYPIDPFQLARAKQAFTSASPTHVDQDSLQHSSCSSACSVHPVACSAFRTATLSIEREQCHPQTSNQAGLRQAQYSPRMKSLISLGHAYTLCRFAHYALRSMLHHASNRPCISYIL